MGWRRAKAGRWSESTIEHRHPRQRPGVCCRPRGRRLAATVAAITTTSGAAWHWRITDGDGTDVESLRRELRRLRAEVLRLEEDKRVLEERVASLGRELEETRKKFPRGMSTS